MDCCAIAGFCSSSTRSSSSAGSVTSAFKVPTLPSKRSRQQIEDQQSSGLQQQQIKPQESPADRPQQRKLHAPKRRATPQVLLAAPFVLGAAAAPDRASHGESCCDESLLSCWCPISGKRQRSLPVDPSSSSSTTTASSLAPPQLQRQNSPPGFNISSSVATGEAAGGIGLPPKPLIPTASPAAAVAAVGSAGLSAAEAIEAKACSRPASRAEAVQSLERLLHEDLSYRKPSSDCLLFSKSHQQPVHNWTGLIKHRSAGNVVELCKVTLQVGAQAVWDGSRCRMMLTAAAALLSPCQKQQHDTGSSDMESASSCHCLYQMASQQYVQ